MCLIAFDEGAARTWTKEVNKLVIKSYIQSDPSKRRYRKRITAIWAQIGVFETSKQRLADQARAIKVNGRLSEVKMEDKRHLNTK